tara:strand:+ start:135 stop:500 length:366 start_codon:yes stop_codon:yes gene_type:complete
MAKQPNLEKAKLASEAYSKMIRGMINALNSDLVDLKVKDDRIKLIPVEKDDTPRKMFSAADRSFKMYSAYIPPSASQATKERVKKRFQQIQKERMKFMGRASMRQGARKMFGAPPSRAETN